MIVALAQIVIHLPIVWKTRDMAVYVQVYGMVLFSVVNARQREQCTEVFTEHMCCRWVGQSMAAMHLLAT